MNPSENEVLENDTEKEQEHSLELYWDRAAKDFKREIFMNTIRPLLKKQLGLNFTEILCEEKAKLLCQKYYEFEDRGEKYEDCISFMIKNLFLTCLLS